MALTQCDKFHKLCHHYVKNASGIGLKENFCKTGQFKYLPKLQYTTHKLTYAISTKIQWGKKARDFNRVSVKTRFFENKEGESYAVIGEIRCNRYFFVFHNFQAGMAKINQLRVPILSTHSYLLKLTKQKFRQKFKFFLSK